MIKRADSTRSIGEAMIRSDVDTREKLKAAAASAGMPVSEYLRCLADEVSKNKQATLDGWEPPVKADSQTTKLTRVMAAIVVLATPWAWVDEFKHPGSIMGYISKGEGELDEVLDILNAKLKAMIRNKTEVRLPLDDKGVVNSEA